MKLITTSLVAVVAAPLLATAGQPVSEPVITAPEVSPWEFRITPYYGWLTALDGSTGPEGSIAEIDASFSDILDVIKMYASLQAEARYERWGFLADAFYANMGSTKENTQDNRKADVSLKQFLGEFEVLYRVAETPKYFLDTYAGVRYNDLTLNLDFAGTLSDQKPSQNWVDPIVGLRGQWNINERWFLASKGDIGGFGVNSDFTWNLQGTVGYNINSCVSIEAGYRYFDTDYEQDGFTYDMAEKGALIAVNIKL